NSQVAAQATACRMQFGDTAECNSALPRAGRREPQRAHEIFGLSRNHAVKSSLTTDEQMKKSFVDVTGAAPFGGVQIDKTIREFPFVYPCPSVFIRG
ncbi:MAG TPA: hypothetical protein VF988_01035, partial [Verrucomicrobiae bacterium]